MEREARIILWIRSWCGRLFRRQHARRIGAIGRSVQVNCFPRGTDPTKHQCHSSGGCLGLAFVVLRLGPQRIYYCAVATEHGD